METKTVQERMEEHTKNIDTKIKEALADKSRPFIEIFTWVEEYMQRCSALYREAENGEIPPGDPGNIDWLFKQLENLVSFVNNYNRKLPGCVQQTVKDFPDPFFL